MTAMVLTAAYLSVNSVDVSNRCKKIELTMEVEEKDITTFASAGWKEILGGIKSSELSVGFNNDLAEGDLDDDLFAIFGTVVPFAVRASSGAIATTNPEYQGNVLIKGLKPVNGSVGDVNEFDVSWTVSGAITRDVTP